MPHDLRSRGHKNIQKDNEQNDRKSSLSFRLKWDTCNKTLHSNCYAWVLNMIFIILKNLLSFEILVGYCIRIILNYCISRHNIMTQLTWMHSDIFDCTKQLLSYKLVLYMQFENFLTLAIAVLGYTNKNNEITFKIVWPLIRR